MGMCVCVCACVFVCVFPNFLFEKGEVNATKWIRRV